MRLLLFLLLGMGMTACGRTTSSADQAELDALFARTRELACLRQELRAELDRLWMTVSDSLDARLPRDMGVDERRNMIAIRNADLIRMFEVYPSLDSSIHQLVDWAEEQDVRLAAKIRQWQDQQQAHESEVQAFLLRIEERDALVSRQWRDSLHGVAEAPCKATHNNQKTGNR